MEELEGFRLVGGTALALQLGHRFSIDLDFFSYNKDLPENFQAYMNIVGIKIENVFLSNRINIFKLNNIKTDFVNYSYNWINPPKIIDGVCMASLEDIAAMKLSAITNRGTKKDFIDIYFLLKNFEFAKILDFYVQKYPEAAVFLLYKSMIYFDDADKEPMPKMFEPIKWQTIKSEIKSITKNYIF